MLIPAKLKQLRTPGNSTTSSSVDIPLKFIGDVKVTLPTLHQDIIYLILEHAYFNHILRPDYKRLAKYALVARAWRKPAQGLLFHEVTIPNDNAYRSLSFIFDDKKSERAQQLAQSVRVLNFWISKTGKITAQKWESRLAPTLHWFPNLYELRLGVDVLDRLSQPTMDALNTTPPIRALQIAMRSDENGRQAAQSVLPFQILGVTAWKLEFLVMRGDMFRATGYTEFPAVTYQLVEFRWSVGHFTGVDDAITYLTANSLKTLEVLHVPEGSHPVVSKTAPTLRSLKVHSRDGIPSKLRHLKELVITESKPIPLDVAFYSSLPPNITHLGLLLPSVEKSQIIALDHKLPSKLQLLSLYSDTLNTGLNQRIVDDRLLRGSGVQVVQHKGKDASMVGMRSDLVHSTVYPRGVSVDNMRAVGRVSGSSESTKRPAAKPTILGGIAAAVNKII